MEIIGNGDTPSPQKRIESNKKIYIGFALILSGAVWLLYNFNIISHNIFSKFFSWQMFLIALGGYLLTLRKRTGGIIFIFTGAAFAVTDWFNLYVPLRNVILPGLLILCGIIIVLQHKK